MPRILIIFYSRTGTTRRLAEALRARCDADIEEIRDARPRRGLFRGWLRSLAEVRRRTETQILPTVKRVEGYDLVVVGTPVWAHSMSSPLRTWLSQHYGHIRQYAVFATQGGSGGDKAIAQVAALCGTPPVASLVVGARDLASPACEASLDAFVARLKRVESLAAAAAA